MKNIRYEKKISPWYITGFTNADGCFSLHVERSHTSRYGYRFSPVFTITQHQRSQDVLIAIQETFQCGNCVIQHKECINYTVRGHKQLSQVVIPHFLKYPLRGAKYTQFQQWYQLVQRLQTGEHTSPQGFVNILGTLSTSRFTSSLQKRKCQTILETMRQKWNVSPHHVVSTVLAPVYKKVPLERDFVTGFIDGDGCFSVSYRKNGRVDVSFSIVQSRISEDLLWDLKTFFGVGNVYRPTLNTSRYMIWQPEEILNTFSVHFFYSPLQTSKSQKWEMVKQICQEKLDTKQN